MALPGQLVFSLLLMMSSHAACTAASLVSLADNFWRWRGQIQPYFYLEQSLTPVFTLLLKPLPLEAARRRQLLNLLQQVPVTLMAARENLNNMRQP